MDDVVLDPDVTDDEITENPDEPSYQDWAELQAPTACSWCSALVPMDRQEDHTGWHAALNAIIENLRAEVQALTTQSTA